MFIVCRKSAEDIEEASIIIGHSLGPIYISLRLDFLLSDHLEVKRGLRSLSFLSAFIFVCLRVFISVCLFVSGSVCVCLCLCLSVCVSLCFVSQRILSLPYAVHCGETFVAIYNGFANSEGNPDKKLCKVRTEKEFISKTFRVVIR